MATIVPPQSANDLWAEAAAQLSDDERQHINFNRPDQLQILVELRADVEKSKQMSIDKRWKFVRKSGETVVIRDVFEKIVRWVDTFKQIGDIAVQYDATHASLPWAGIRLILQIAVNDTQKLALVVEGLAVIAELICRCTVTETLYNQAASKADEGLKRAMVRLYASILGYLSKANQYFKQKTAKRMIKSVVLTDKQLDLGLDAIRTAEKEIQPWMNLVDKDDIIRHQEILTADNMRNQDALIYLLQGMDVPLRRMDDRLKDLNDNLLTTRRNDILKWLSPEPYKKHHIQASQGVLQGTGQWLLSDPNFKKWKDESASSILWLHGIAGSGKSKLVSIVIEDALKDFKAGNNPHPVYFYCSRNPTEPARSDPQAILASLARQLSSTQPGKPLLQPSIDLYDEEEAEGFVSGPPQLDQSLKLIMQLIELYPQTTIVLDALDECDPAIRLDLLRALEDILQRSCSLVKIFVSSRNDQDIVRKLNGYLNLEIDSRKNSNDIAQFVNAEVERLIKDGRLLRNSKSKNDMKRMIIRKVTKDAAEMFRWASMQLQYLCSFKFDIDIEKSLGRIPPDLYTLYGDIYDVLSNASGDREASVFNNVLRWLLCAQKTLEIWEFLAVVSVDPSDKTDSDPLAKEDVLEICNNFVVFDDQLHTFRFAHLSVREFLEQRLNTSTAHGLMAEICLWSVLSDEDEVATTDLLRQLKLRVGPVSTPPDISRPSARRTSTPSVMLYRYAVVYWAPHCKLAGDNQKSGTLQLLLRHILSHEPSFVRWNVQLLAFLDERFCNRDAQMQHCDTIALQTSVLMAHLNPTNNGGIAELFLLQKFRSPNGLWMSILAVCCVFDFGEQLASVLKHQMPETLRQSEHQQSLQLAAKYGNLAILRKLLITKHWSTIEVPSEVIEAAAYNSDNAEELITLLFSHPGGTAAISEEALCAAANNTVSGEILMPIFLRRLKGDTGITSERVEAAAGNPACGYYVMRFFLAQLKADVAITTSMVKAAKGNARYGGTVLQLLFDRAGADTPCTLEIVKEAAGNELIRKEVMLRLLDQLGADTSTTLDLIKIAAGNRGIKREVMLRLLDQLGADIPLPLDVVKTAAGNRGIDKSRIPWWTDHPGMVDTVTDNKGIEKEVMLCLLDQLEAGASITANIAATIIRRYDTDVIAFLFEQRGADVQITELVVRAAAYSDEKGTQGKMAILLKRLERADAPIPVKLMALIVECSHENMIASLLDQRGTDVPITEEVVRAVVNGPRNEARRKLAVLLERREQEMHEALARLAGVKGVGGFDEFNARVICSEGWIYLRRDRSSGVLSVR